MGFIFLKIKTTENNDFKRINHLAEDRKEESEMKKDKKKCWFCKSNLHLKRTCPWIRCFYCKKYGHLKKDCFRRKVNFIFNREIERFMNREEEKKNRKKLNKQKKEQKELEKKYLN